jgi:oligoendopeptidase F
MGDFARRAFDESWIDAEPREGKVGGAYCTHFGPFGVSRVLANFNGSFSSVTTVAHELGHAFHGDTIKDLPPVQTAYPMTLAETASIFAETIAFEGAVERAPAAEKASLLELNLQDSTQVIVDILSRFRFEKEVFSRRASGELSPEDFSSLMLEAQKATYGEALDHEALHPYMWAVKGHYYSPDLGFYNFPYAFGQLFALGLFARFKAEGKAFFPAYVALLRETGRASAEAVTALAGFDISTEAFWQSGVDVIAAQVREFSSLVDKGRS